MRVSAAAWSSVIPFFSRCARGLSPSLLKGLDPFGFTRSGKGLPPFRPSPLAAAPAPIRHDVHLAHLPGPLRGADDTLALHEVDETARAREADRHLPLEHGYRSLPGPLHDVHGLFVPLVVDVVAGVLARPGALLVLEDREVVMGLALLLPVAGDELDLLVRHEHAPAVRGLWLGHPPRAGGGPPRAG